MKDLDSKKTNSKKTCDLSFAPRIPDSFQKITREFYARDTVTVSQELLGKYLVHQKNHTRQIGKIVEVEAYLGSHDLASHSSKGLTKRNAVMFGPPGYAYVYLIYGMYYCLNVVTEKEGHPSAVLIRAVEPTENIKLKTQGPGLLCKAMQIDKELNGHDMENEKFFIASGSQEAPFKIIKRPRVGVDYAKHWAKRLLRFYIKGNQFVSRI